MRKGIYLIEGLENESYRDFSKRVIALAQEAFKKEDLSKLKLVYTQGAPPILSIIPFKKKKIAAISLFTKDEEKLPVLSDNRAFSGSYIVEEAIPVKYEKSWEDGKETPGICLFTLFKQKKGISYEQFIDTWHHSHTPLSLKIHPLWNYNRNVVTQKIMTNSAPWDGIVEEQFRTKSELLNPIKFFGNPLIMGYRMWQVYSDTNSFLDYKTIEPYFAKELIFKS